MSSTAVAELGLSTKSVSKSILGQKKFEISSKKCWDGVVGLLTIQNSLVIKLFVRIWGKNYSQDVGKESRWSGGWVDGPMRKYSHFMAHLPS